MVEFVVVVVVEGFVCVRIIAMNTTFYAEENTTAGKREHTHTHTTAWKSILILKEHDTGTETAYPPPPRRG